MKSVAFLICLLASGPVAAYANFAGNPYLPFPPSCVQDMGSRPGSALAVHGAKFHESEITLQDRLSGGAFPVRFAAYRSPCAEPNRSLVWVEFTVPEHLAGTAFLLELPLFAAETREHFTFLMRPVSGPDGWGAGDQSVQGRTFLASTPNILPNHFGTDTGERRWVYLLGMLSPGAHDTTTMTPTEYNAAFRLLLRYPPYTHVAIDVPATADVLPQAAMPLPLTGRHSGAWVVAGADNQGVLLSVSEQIGWRNDFVSGIAEMPLLVFFSQFTFDAEQQPIWLAGNAEFQPGASAVTIEIYSFRDGQFRDDTPAQREHAGQVTLTSNTCNDVTFAYDYSSIGLGSGSTRLQRAVSLETAGHACRDHEARIAANP